MTRDRPTNHTPAFERRAAAIGLSLLLALALPANVATAQTTPAQAARTGKPQDLKANSHEKQVAAQQDGDYGPPPDLFPLGAFQPAFNSPKPARDQTEIGVKHYEWSGDTIMTVRARHGMLTNILFPSWEIIDKLYLADQNNFGGIVAAPAVVLISVKRPGADTNAIAVGRSGNVYNFYIRGEDVNSKIVPDMTVIVAALERPQTTDGTPGFSAMGTATNLMPVSTLGPQGIDSRGPHYARTSAGGATGSPATSAATADFAREIPFDPSQLVFDLGIYAKDDQSAAIRPQRVFRDQNYTYVDYGENADSLMTQPVVSLVIDGTESPVNTHVAGPHRNIIVVEGVGDLTLRNGEKVICIKRLPAGTHPKTDASVTTKPMPPSEPTPIWQTNGAK